MIDRSLHEKCVKSDDSNLIRSKFDAENDWQLINIGPLIFNQGCQFE